MDSGDRVWAVVWICATAFLVVVALTAHSCQMNQDAQWHETMRDCIHGGGSVIGGECLRGCK